MSNEKFRAWLETLPIETLREMVEYLKSLTMEEMVNLGKE